MTVPVMDLETLKHLEKTAVDAAGTFVKDRICIRPDLPDKTKWGVIDKNGDLTLHDVSQPARLHSLLSVQEVVAFSKLFASTESTGYQQKPIVWIGHDSIIVTLDDRRLFGDRAIYKFDNTPEWDLLTTIAVKSDGFQQAQLLRLLRVNLAECFVLEEVRQGLIPSLRKVKSQQHSGISQGSGSYEANISAENGVEWPEQFDLKLRVIDDPALKAEYVIRCVFDVEPQPPRFVISPLAAHVAKAEREARELASEVIRQELKDTTIPVFLGKPE